MGKTPRPVMTRQELHQLVWSKSLEAAAVDLQMSASGLKKVCRRHGVPVPSASHWDKAKRPPPTPLPPHAGYSLRPVQRHLPHATSGSGGEARGGQSGASWRTRLKEGDAPLHPGDSHRLVGGDHLTDGALWS